MDDVMADTHAAALTWLEGKYAYKWETEHRKQPLWKLAQEQHLQHLDAALREGAFFGDIPMMPGSQDALRVLSDKFEIFVATAAMEYPNSFAAKFRWLERHFPFIRPSHIVFCGDKSILNADYLLDDTPSHFRRFRGQGILFSAPHNMGETRYPRVSSWEEAQDLLWEGKV